MSPEGCGDVVVAARPPVAADGQWVSVRAVATTGGQVGTVVAIRPVAARPRMVAVATEPAVPVVASVAGRDSVDSESAVEPAVAEVARAAAERRAVVARLAARREAEARAVEFKAADAPEVSGRLAREGQPRVEFPTRRHDEGGPYIPCMEEDKRQWDLDHGGYGDWQEAIGKCLGCPALEACTQLLDESYPDWGEQTTEAHRSPALRNPVGVIWAGRTFSAAGVLLTELGMRRVASQVAARAAARERAARGEGGPGRESA